MNYNDLYIYIHIYRLYIQKFIINKKKQINLMSEEKQKHIKK